MSDETEDTQEKSGKTKGFFFKVFPYILVLALGVVGGIGVAQQRPEWFGLGKSAASAQAEVDAVVAQISKLIALPSDEKPTLATVTDASKVKDQPFFQNAKNDDKVLIYQKSQKAILYRPSENKIIEVGSVNINNQAVSPSASPSASPSSTPKAKEE